MGMVIPVCIFREVLVGAQKAMQREFGEVRPLFNVHKGIFALNDPCFLMVLK
jgi:hypothetical protein